MDLRDANASKKEVSRYDLWIYIIVYKIFGSPVRVQVNHNQAWD